MTEGRIRRRYGPIGPKAEYWSLYRVYPQNNRYTSSPTITRQSSHECIDRTNTGPPYRSGGGLKITHSTTDRAPHEINSLRRKGTALEHRIVGTGFCNAPSGLFNDIETDPYYLWAQGSTGMARAKPAVAQAGLSVMLAETRQLPQLFKSNGTLNREFGWNTTAREVQSLYDTFINMKTHLGQLRRDNGKKVRRRVRLSKTRVVNTGAPTLGSYTSYTTGIDQTKQRRTTVYSYEQETWYVGKFKYFIPEHLFEPEWQWLLEARIAGLDVNAEVIWDTTPYTWLLDWFVNVGDIVSNVNSYIQDNLVQEYGYVMQSQKARRAYEVRFRDYDENGKVIVRYINPYTELEVKQRVFGHPYSFGPTPGSLSTKQLSILGALGLSKLGGGSKG